MTRMNEKNTVAAVNTAPSAIIMPHILRYKLFVSVQPCVSMVLRDYVVA
ncbi:unnamed protein product [Ixodes pacificus]